MLGYFCNLRTAQNKQSPNRQNSLSLVTLTVDYYNNDVIIITNNNNSNNNNDNEIVEDHCLAFFEFQSCCSLQTTNVFKPVSDTSAFCYVARGRFFKRRVSCLRLINYKS
jgi:hypothetical protein